MSATKSDEVRARVEPIVKLALDKQAELERLSPPDILRKALWDYLVKEKSPFITTHVRTNTPQSELQFERR